MTGRLGGTALDEETGKHVFYARNEEVRTKANTTCALRGDQIPVLTTACCRSALEHPEQSVQSRSVCCAHLRPLRQLTSQLCRRWRARRSTCTSGSYS